MRAPQRTRARTSRANASVPNRCVSDGGAFLRRTMSPCATQLCPAKRGPTSATTTRATMTASDHRAVRWARSRPSVEAPLFTDTRVERDVERVGDEVADNDQHRADNNGCRHEVVVAVADGARGEHADARP